MWDFTSPAIISVSIDKLKAPDALVTFYSAILWNLLTRGGVFQNGCKYTMWAIICFACKKEKKKEEKRLIILNHSQKSS